MTTRQTQFAESNPISSSGIHRALVALDGSECAWRALSAALDRTRQVPSTVLHLLTVRSPFDTPEDTSSWRERQRTQRLATLRTDWVLRQAEQCIAPDGPQFTKDILEGEPAKLIAQRAGQLKCEVIFVGTHGTSGLKTQDMGSVAARVCALSMIPVRLVK